MSEPGNGQQNGNGNGNGQIVSLKDKVNGVRDLIGKMKGQFKMALPQHFDVERFNRMAVTACQKNTDLLDCETGSLMGALVECAQLGLEPNTALGHAYLVPFWNGRNRRNEVQLIPGYKGLIKLAYQSGMVDSYRAHIVRAKDFFEYEYGMVERLVHRPCRTADAGEMVAAYAVAKVKGVESFAFWVLEKWECEALRDKFSIGYQRARNKENNPWVRNFDEMCMKSAARRLAKWLPSDTEKTMLQRAVDLDERAESGIDQEFTNVIDIAPSDIRNLDEPSDGKAEPAAGGTPTTSAPAPEEAKSRLDRLTAAKKAGKKDPPIPLADMTAKEREAWEAENK